MARAHAPALSDGAESLRAGSRKHAIRPADKTKGASPIRAMGEAPSVKPLRRGQAFAATLALVLALPLVPGVITRCSGLDLSRAMTSPAMTANSASGART